MRGGAAPTVYEYAVARVAPPRPYAPSRAPVHIAAINSGNSGGPAFCVEDGTVVGIAFQSMAGSSEAEGIGYIIPTPVIEHGAAMNAAVRPPRTRNCNCTCNCNVPSRRRRVS